MRIIHLLQSPRFSGAENVVCQIIGLMRNEPDMEMFYCSRDGQIREALEERNISFIPIKDITVNEVKYVIKKYKPDIIHAHDMRASYIAVRAAGKIPVISHIHNNNFDSRGLSVKSIAYLYAGFKSKHIFWVSDSSYNGYAFHKFLSQKSEVLYNIIDIDALYEKMKLDENNYEYDIVYLGRLTYPKNPTRLLKVFKGVINKMPNVKIVVIGTGELEEQMHLEARKMKLNKNINFLGFQSNPYKILYNAKLMLMTSRWEGTPMCVLEAMSLGVPVVSTPTDGVSIVVKNEKTGYLYDEDEELINACCKLVEDSKLRESMSRASCIRAKELMDSKVYKEKIVNVYKSVL